MSSTRRRAHPRQRPIHVVVSLDGGPLADTCGCPVCADLDRRGVTRYALDARGELCPLLPGPPRPTISVRVVPTLSTAPYVGVGAFVEVIPEGCLTWDFLQYLRLQLADLGDAFAPEELSLRRERRPLAGDEVLSLAAHDPAG
jgi:hypothetical protein